MAGLSVTHLPTALASHASVPSPGITVLSHMVTAMTEIISRVPNVSNDLISDSENQEQIGLGYVSFSVGWKAIKEEECQKYWRRDGQCYKYE